MRLLFYARHAQFLVAWYSLWAVIVSIYYAVMRDDAPLPAVAAISFSVMVLVASAFLNGLSHKERSLLVKECYEKLKELYEVAKNGKVPEDEILEEYDSILSVCENHTNRDFYEARCEAYLTATDKSDIDPQPTTYVWLVVSTGFLARYAFLTTLYIFPPILFAAIQRYL